MTTFAVLSNHSDIDTLYVIFIKVNTKMFEISVISRNWNNLFIHTIQDDARHNVDINSWIKQNDWKIDSKNCVVEDEVSSRHILEKL